MNPIEEREDYRKELQRQLAYWKSIKELCGGTSLAKLRSSNRVQRRIARIQISLGRIKRAD